MAVSPTALASIIRLLESEVLDILEFNETINYQIYNSKWAVVIYNDEQAYVHRYYISQDENHYNEFSVPNNEGFKSYMSYNAITNETSKQYKLQKHLYFCEKQVDSFLRE